MTIICEYEGNEIKYVFNGEDLRITKDFIRLDDHTISIKGLKAISIEWNG